MFKDIKVGDKVLMQAHVIEGLARSNRFFVPEIVEKTAATRFSVKGKVYTKKDGKVYGCDPYLGNSVIPYSEDRDQSAEYKSFCNLVIARQSSKDRLEALMKKINKQTSIEDLNEIIIFCESMSSRINGGV